MTDLFKENNFIACTENNAPLEPEDIQALKEFQEYRKLRAKKVKCYLCKKQAVINVVMRPSLSLPSCKNHVVEINELNNIEK